MISVLASLVLARPSPRFLLIGMGFMALGLLLRGWACGHLSKESELTTSGPYCYTRNPLYLGSMIIGIGVTTAARSWWVAGLFALNFLLIYPVAVRKEREIMQRLFPDAYAEFSRRVPLFFPRWKPNPHARDKSFSWALYKTNKEYRALKASLLYAVFLILKLLCF
jgi:protein-S-isoprenylcysteine O-methyltransferase Ste14